jgi:hypothetical protein
MVDFKPFRLMDGNIDANTDGMFVYQLYGLTEFRWGTIIAIKVVTRLGLCGTWTHIVFKFVLPPTKKGSPSY